MSRKPQAGAAVARPEAKPEIPAEGTAPAQPIPAALQGPEPTGAAAEVAAPAAAPVVAKADAQVAKAGKAAVVTVKGPAKGRWRIGRHFTPEPVEIPVADLDEQQIERLKADPELTCTWPA